MMNILRQIKSFAVAAAITALIASFAHADAPEYSIGSSWDKYFGLFYKGASHGIKAEQNFEVWRDGKKIGIFTVRQLSDTVSKGIFTPDAPDEILKDGDKLRPAAATVQGPSPAAGTTKDDKAPPKTESASSSEKKTETPAQTVEQPKSAAEAKQEPKPAAATVRTEEKAVPAKKTETQPAAVVEKKTETKPAAAPSKQEKPSTEPVVAVAPKETAPKKAEEVKKETPKEPEKAAPAQTAVEQPKVAVAEKPAAAAAPATDSSVAADTGEKHETTSARRERVVALKTVEEIDSAAPAQQKTEPAPAASSDASKSTPEKTAEADKSKVAAKPAAVVEPTAKTEQKTQETESKTKIEEIPAPAKEVKPAEPAPVADRKSKKAEKAEEKPAPAPDEKKPELALAEKKAEPKPPAPAQPPQDEPKKAEKQLKDIPPKTDAPPESGEWTAERHVYKANSFFIDRSYHRALEHYAAALAIDPANEYARKGVVEASKKLGIVSPLTETAKPDTTRPVSQKTEEEPKKQTTYFTKEDEPLLDNSGTYNNFGVYLIKQNEYAQAVEWLDKAIARNANVPLYYRNRAVANYRLGNILDAVHDAKKAMDLGDERAKEMLKTLRGLIQAGQNADN
ncbi:MAG TPA: hypothetical protein PKH33_06550 [bacterium]|nr:hypothetical protein [bacterium]